MHFQNAKIGKNQFWRYLLTIFISFICLLVFQVLFALPLIVQKQNLGIDNVTFQIMFKSFDFSLLQLSKTYILTMLLTPLALFFFVFAFLLKLIHKKPLLKVMTGRDRFHWRRVFIGFVTTVLLLSILNFVFLPHDIFTYQFDLDLFIPLFFVAIIVIPLQSTLEEVFMRGYLFQAFGLLFKNKMVSMVLIIILFTTLHFGNPELNDHFSNFAIQYLLISSVLGLIAVFDDGLEIPIGIHTANNLFLALFISVKGGTFTTDSVFQTTLEEIVLHDNLWLSALSSTILVALFFYIYKWKFSTLFSKPKGKAVLK